MDINKIIELWLEEEKKSGSYVNYNHLDRVTLDGKFDLNDLQHKLLQSIVEMIDSAPQATRDESQNEKTICADDLKEKLLEGNSK